MTKADVVLPSDHLKVIEWESVYADLIIVYVPVLSVPGMAHTPDILTGADKYISSAVTWLKYTPGSNGEISGSGSGSGDDAHPEIKTQQKKTKKNCIGGSLFLSIFSTKIQKIIQIYP